MYNIKLMIQINLLIMIEDLISRYYDPLQSQNRQYCLNGMILATQVDFHSIGPVN